MNIQKTGTCLLAGIIILAFFFIIVGGSWAMLMQPKRVSDILAPFGLVFIGTSALIGVWIFLNSKTEKI